MVKSVMALAAAALLAAATGNGGQSGAAPLTVSAIRFYSPVRATTTIEGVSELRLGAMAAGAAADTIHYREEVDVFDSAGLELQKSELERSVSASVARATGATSVETFVFAAAPGRYRLVVRAIPETGEPAEGAIEVQAYANPPPISDLLLATAARQPASDSEAVEPGEVERGGLVLRTAPVPHLTPTAAGLSYYAEIYPWVRATTAEAGSLRVVVLGAGGHVVTATAPRPIQAAAAGEMARGSLDLTGLPAGDYTLRLEVRMGDSSVATEAPFSMGALTSGTAPAAQMAAAAGAADPLAAASEATLDSMYGPLSYLLQSNEQGIYPRLSVDGKRRFLEEFWRRRDSTSGMGPNSAMATFYGLVDYANRAFREGGAGRIPGWKTDRGRIFLRNGHWDEILQRPMASPDPFDVWKYTRGRQLYYVFQDQTGLGHYVLIGTNDRRETGMQNWQQYLQPEDFQDVARFLGLSLMAADSTP